MLCRAGSTVIAADAGATMAAVFAAASSGMRLQTIDGFRSALPGTNISVPEVWPGAASYGSGAGTPYESAQYWDFVGRGSTGHRVRVALFGAIGVTAGGDYRISVGELSNIAAVLAELTSDGDIFLDIDYQVPVWHQYADSGVNAYWRNKIR
jgi:hypothetical protein